MQTFFEQQPEIWYDMLYVMIELVKGMGHKLSCMHVHKELMPSKWICDVKSGIELGPC